MAETIRTVEQLCAENGIDARQLAERVDLDEQRVVAIVLGRWTPSPQERDRIASAFGLTRDDIAWGHKIPVQHFTARGRREKSVSTAEPAVRRGSPDPAVRGQPIAMINHSAA